MPIRYPRPLRPGDDAYLPLVNGARARVVHTSAYSELTQTLN
ncbi:hypothetical protein [Streptomyces californicus]|nr:hypothetical protein [Streptomyces californicus]MDW4916041.1 hypothetical protein [Streptomyces californicus]